MTNNEELKVRIVRNVAVIGGGPAGIFAARLIKRRHPEWTVTLYERNAPDAVYGFGVSLGGQVLAVVKDVDPDVHDDLVRLGLMRDSSQRLVVGNESVDWKWGGWKSLSISRAELLNALQERAGQVGVRMRFNSSVTIDDLPEADLIIAADGANSAVREARPDVFLPNPRAGRIQAIWLGARAAHVIDRSIFVIRENEHGAWAMHAYPHGDGLATLVIEAAEETLVRADLGRRESFSVAAPGASDLKSRDYLAELFADYLDGAELLISNSRWFTFSMVRNGRWATDRIVLIGDAAHTAHFSIGSGTRLGFEDGIDLADALDADDSISTALAAFERNRRPAVEKLQAAALPSQRWWETFAQRTHLPIRQAAVNYISRTGFYPLSRFELHDPEFVVASREGFVTAAAGSGDDPLEAPLTVGRGAFGSRRILLPELEGAAGALSPVRMVVSGKGGEPMISIPGLTVDIDSPEILAVINRYKETGLRFLDVRAGFESLTVDAAAKLGTIAHHFAKVIPTADLGLFLTITDLPNDPDDSSVAPAIAMVREAAGMKISAFIIRGDGAERDKCLAAIECAERIRLDTGVPVGYWGPDLGGDMLATAIVGGRIDFVVSEAERGASPVTHLEVLSVS